MHSFRSLTNVYRHAPCHWMLACGIVIGINCGVANLTGDEPKRTGEQVYKTLCASCHGATGEGSKQHGTPLMGDRSVSELTKLIEKTMPEGEPEKCVGEDAKQVADYIYNQFYSPAAQMRNKPARIELSRLTVRQYQQSLADLMLGLQNSRANVSPERGLRGEYYKSRDMNNQNRVIERVDRAVDFQFGLEAPEKEKFDPAQFSIRWSGSLVAPETADYEFIVRTEHAARLYINDTRQPLIDAWVKSGNDVEYRGTIRLLAGRAYPLRLEYSKGKQGVKDKKEPPPSASSISLLWKLPQRVVEVVPLHCLSPKGSQEVFVVETAFPPDDRSVGYERGTSISKAWEEATTDGAIEVATYVLARLEPLAGVKNLNDESPKKLQDFCAKFAELAFRRPLTDAQKLLYIERQFAAPTHPLIAVKQCILLVMKSPRFLYREIQSDGGDGYDVAARLSFGLWDSLPDKDLLNAASKGELASRDKVKRHAERMLNDWRTRAKLHEFFLKWLKVDHIPDLAKDQQKFPDFGPELATDLRTSLELFIDDVVWGEKSDYRQLLLADTVPLNPRLAKFYGTDFPTEGLSKTSSFEPVALNGELRAGVLTHPYLLASFAYTNETSPIHRGVMISRSLLGRALRAPPEAVAPLPADLHANLTTRERVALQTKSEACIVCHGMINPLGFTLENFDAIGRFRAEERGKPVNTSGEYLTREGDLVKFSNVRDLAKFLADGSESHGAIVTQLFHHLIKQPIRAYSKQDRTDLKQTFEKNDCNIRKLVVDIVTTAALP